MARFRTAIAEDSSEGQIDMGPMIDCVFILLIFFIVTTTFVDETGVEVDKPTATSSAQLEKNSILLALTSKGEVVYDKRDIGIGSVRATVRRLLQKDDTVPVVIQADENAPTGLLVRVIDEAKLGGAQKVSLASKKPNT